MTLVFCVYQGVTYNAEFIISRENANVINSNKKLKHSVKVWELKRQF